jgi:hypothetical protein
MTAAFEALYTACSCGILTMLPLIDAVAMKLPATKFVNFFPSNVVPSFFCLRKCAPALLAHHMTPSTLTSITRRALSVGPSMKAPSSQAIPLLATKTSSRPSNSATMSLIACSTASGEMTLTWYARPSPSQCSQLRSTPACYCCTR